MKKEMSKGKRQPEVKEEKKGKGKGDATPKKFPAASIRILDKGKPVAIFSLFGKVSDWGSIILSGSESRDDDISYQVFMDNGYAARAAYAKSKEAEEGDNSADIEDESDDEDE